MRTVRTLSLLILLSFVFVAGAAAQQASSQQGPGQQASAPAVQPPPMQFRGISLGMGIDDVKAALKADPLFRYRGDPDVSFLPQSNQYLIECDGATYIRRAYFQFADSRLFIMILVLDPLSLDHYSLFSALSAKYGQPASLSPQEQTQPVTRAGTPVTRAKSGTSWVTTAPAPTKL